ncbi:long-chain acyl-CoA synthetase [Microbulbifer donghaiensis]|uniref:Long-chain-fatty-acid--CoA ligase n=1 Tax=Microbulbifer donghaiensis TaxID=494016 RepID=A0A1M5IKK7_9GAMM|nr:AMP-binding protein [Microbulbifer donghaiensis]SHG28868.1 long-chain acyl-CoA synthetase [Microbulbifer donghaiensis]
MSDQKLYPQFRNAAEFIEFHCNKFSDKPAYHCLGQTLTFAELEEKSRSLAKWLQYECGLQAGDRIAIQLPNITQYPIAAYAALRAGLVVVNTNPLYTPREMKHQFTDAGARALVILADMLPKFEEIKADTGIEHVLVTGAADLIAPPQDKSHGYCDFVAAMEQGTALPELQPLTATREDIAVLQYTGGTTGVAKGAALTHENILANAAQMLDRISQRCSEGEEIFVCPLPLYHIYAFTVNMMALFSLGAMNVLIPNPRDLDGFVKTIQPFEFTGLAGINTLFVGLCRHPGFQALDFSSLKVTFSGGSALTSAAADLWHSVTGCPVTEGYGLSETSPVATLNTFGAEEIGTVGSPLIQTKVEAWDEDGNALPVGEVGELVISGPQVMLGYWQRPEETAKVMHNGFFRTGDMGMVQANGNIKIVDRLKDMIIVSGFNVYPNEVEDVLTRHPQVVEAAVTGTEDDKTGEAVVAHLVLAGDISEREIVDYCRQELTAYKVPKHVIVHKELPKSTVGKILRRELRDQPVPASA